MSSGAPELKPKNAHTDTLADFQIKRDFALIHDGRSARSTLIKEYLNETGHFMDKRAGGIQIFFDAEKDAEAMPTM